MKKWLFVILSFPLILSLLACGGASDNGKTEIDIGKTKETKQSENKNVQIEKKTTNQDCKKGKQILVAYFSATGTTEKVAKQMAEALDADLYEIVPNEIYSAEDLNYNNDSCRANKEQNDRSIRPKISGKIEKFNQYDVILIGHPIWWGEEPRIMDTFMESYDWSEKILVDFCTSGGSGISTSTSHLKALAPDADWLEGHRFEGASRKEIRDWLKTLNIGY